MSFHRVAWTDPHLKRQYLNVVGISNLQLQRDKQPIDTITSITTGDNDDRVAADDFYLISLEIKVAHLLLELLCVQVTSKGASEKRLNLLQVIDNLNLEPRLLK